MTRSTLRSGILGATLATAALACSGPRRGDDLVGPPPNERLPIEAASPPSDGGMVPAPPTESEPVDLPQGQHRERPRGVSPVVAQATTDAGVRGADAGVLRDAGVRDAGGRDGGIGGGDAGIGGGDAGIDQPAPPTAPR